MTGFYILPFKWVPDFFYFAYGRQALGQSFSLGVSSSKSGSARPLSTRVKNAWLASRADSSVFTSTRSLYGAYLGLDTLLRGVHTERLFGGKPINCERQRNSPHYGVSDTRRSTKQIAAQACILFLSSCPLSSRRLFIGLRLLCFCFGHYSGGRANHCNKINYPTHNGKARLRRGKIIP